MDRLDCIACAAASSAAYEVPHESVAYLRDAEFEQLGGNIQGKSGFFVRVFVNHDEAKVIVAIRGSDNSGDWIRNILDQVTDAGMMARVKGLVQLMKRLRTEHDDCGKYLWMVTGHSLGGNLAQIVSRLTNTQGAAFNAPPPRKSFVKGTRQPRFFIHNTIGDIVSELGDERDLCSHEKPTWHKPTSSRATAVNHSIYNLWGRHLGHHDCRHGGPCGAPDRRDLLGKGVDVAASLVAGFREPLAITMWKAYVAAKNKW